MERFKTARNVLIVAAIAAGIYFIPGGGRAAHTFVAAMWVAFGLGVSFVTLRFYRERRLSIAALGDRGRGLLYVVIGLVLFLFEASWWVNGGGLRELGWFLLAAFGLWAAMEVFRSSRSY